MISSTHDQTFVKDVLQSRKPVLVDFWAEWCFPCKMVAPIIEMVSREAADTAVVLRLNVEENPQITSQYNIRGIPTVLLFRNGRVEREFVGVRPAMVYLNAIRNTKKKAPVHA